MNLTLITVNYNNARDTIGLLRSLESQTTSAFDVIVVDNDSDADDRALLGSYAVSSPLSLDIIYSGRNLGFSGGNNLATRKAMAQGAQWMLIINNDTSVDEHFIASLIAELPAQPALVALPLREGDRVAYAGILEWLYSTLPHRYRPVGTSHSFGSFYAVGAGMAVHRAVFETVGLLDERYFLYFEDADFSMRVRRAGIPIMFIDGPMIEHGVSKSTKALGSPLLLRYHMRNAILFNALHAPWWARIGLPVWVALVGVKQLLKSAVGHAPLQSRAILAGIADAIARRWGHIPTAVPIAIECESLEDSASWGVARLIRGLLKELTSREGIERRFTFHLYFKARIPDEPWLTHPSIRTHIVRAPSWLPLPASFSLYYYLMLPLRLWWDAPSLTYWPNYMLPLIAPRPSLVMLTEDIWHEMHNARVLFRYRAAYFIFANFAAISASRIMAISHASKKEMHRLFGIPLARIDVNELAVDVPRNGVVPMPGPYILFVGQAFERRRLRESIIAFGDIASRYPAMRFIAIGPDKYDPPVIKDLVARTNERLGRPAVQHIERVSDDDLARFYAGAHTIVYASGVEAFGLPPLEALSYRVPAILADTPLNREIYGDHAFYASTLDSTGIGAALERALADVGHREAIRAQAQSIVARYTWKAHADRMLRIIGQLTTTPTS